MPTQTFMSKGFEFTWTMMRDDVNCYLVPDCQNYEFLLPDYIRGAYTLQELVTQDGGFHAMDEGDPEEVDLTLYGYNTKLWDFSDAGSTEYYCWAMGFNYLGHDHVYPRWINSGKARIGVLADTTTPCNNPHIIEGIGLYMNYAYYYWEKQGSGRAHRGSNAYSYFRPAYVEVFGTPGPQNDLDRTFIPLKMFNYSSFVPQYQLLDPTEHSIAAADDPVLFIVHLRMERLENSWGYFLRYGDTNNERSPHFIIYYSLPTSNLYRLWYDGREMLNYISCDESYAHNVAPWAQFSLGKWHQYAFLNDMWTSTIYFDGVPIRSDPCVGKRTIHQYDQYLYMAQLTRYPAMYMNDVRYYGNQRLGKEELTSIYNAFLEGHTACGDGTREFAEECDDGNQMSGDGCSASCTIESGFVCIGANTTRTIPDYCSIGETVVDFDFESPVMNIETGSYLYSQATNWGVDTLKVYNSDLSGNTNPNFHITSGCLLDPLLGGYNAFGFAGVSINDYTDLEFNYTALPSHNYVQVEGYLALLDTWDNEYMELWVGSTRVWRQRKYYQYKSAGSIVPWTGTTMANDCGAGNQDDYVKIKISFAHNESDMNMTLTSTLNTAPSGESWGVHNLTVTFGINEPFPFEYSAVPYSRPSLMSLSSPQLMQD